MDKTEQTCAMCGRPVKEPYVCALRFVHSNMPGQLSAEDEDNILWMGGLCKDCLPRMRDRLDKFVDNIKVRGDTNV